MAEPSPYRVSKENPKDRNITSQALIELLALQLSRTIKTHREGHPRLKCLYNVGKDEVVIRETIRHGPLCPSSVGDIYPQSYALQLTNASRAKLAHDPNNSHWTQSSSKYGQRILESQGWKSGDAIGQQRKATTDPQSVFSRLSIKDGNLGLGARNIRGVDEEPTGLADFQDLLGRLNGKSEVSIQRTQQVRGAMARHRYLERRGTIAFVKGGYMEHEELKKLVIPESAQSHSAPTNKTMNSVAQPIHDAAQDYVRPSGVSQIDASHLEAQAKAAKKQRKEERRQRKRQKKLVSGEQAEGLAVEQRENVLEPAVSTVAAPVQPANNRNLVRQRYIRQKQLAMSDMKALNEILMIKS